MRAASPHFAAPAYLPAQRHRPIVLALVLLVHALIVFLLIRMGPPDLLDMSAPPTTITLIPEPGAAPEPSPVPEIPIRREETSPAETPAAAPDTTEALPIAPKSSIWSEVVPLTRDEMAAADRAIRQSERPAQDGAQSDGTALAFQGITDDSAGPGTGPNGETLYNARWYRRPTDAELSSYIPSGWRRDGWGMIACRTVPENRVEDCFELGQTPGSGLAGAVRQAAWQFRVLPPRIGGHAMVGEWVRIRIDYSFAEANGPSRR